MMQFRSGAGGRFGTFARVVVLVCAGLVASCGGSGGGGGGSGGGSVAIAPPVIASQPQSQRLGDGAAATFSAGVSGSAPFSYQWLRNGAPINGANGASFSIGAVNLGDSGATFSVIVSNSAGTVTSAAATLTVFAVAPSIADNTPKTVTVVAGSTATFSVTATGTAPLAFQWRRNGAAIAGATSSTYTTPATVLADSGTVFDVVVSNPVGALTSAPFTLSVTPNTTPPTIATQPQSVTVRVGDPATFSVVASGPGPYTYQWLRNGVPIVGAQSASYTLPNSILTDNGAQFSVVVSNAAASATSASVLLVVLPQPGIALVAGNVGGSGFVNATGSSARFVAPANVALDAAGNLFVADGSTVRRISTSAVVTTFAGSPNATGTTDGAAASARFGAVGGVVVLGSGDVIVTDSANNTIRRITSAGVVSTFAGTAGTAGSADGAGTAATFNAPTGITADATGNLYVVDTGGHVVRKVTTAGVVTTIAGSGATAGSADGTGAAARFNAPRGITVDAASNLYVADTGNHTIRMITSSGVVTTIAGAAGAAGDTDGVGIAARFNTPASLSIDAAGNLYVAESVGDVVRKVAPSRAVTTLAGSAGAVGSADGAGTSARFTTPLGIASDASGRLFVADFANATIRSVSTTGVVSTFAALAAVTGSADGTGAAATFNLPFSVAVDVAGTIYVGDYSNGTIRKVSPLGVVTTLAGTAGAFGSTDGTGPAARFATVQGLAVDRSGNVYVADRDNATIRKVTPAGVVTTLAGSPGVVGSADGTGAAATFNAPTSLTVDAAGTVYVVDGNPSVRKITPAGVVTTIAGGLNHVGSADGPGASASFNNPQGITIDAAGNLFVADSGNGTVRKVTQAGVVSTVAGVAGSRSITDGGPATARLSIPYNVVVDGGGTLYVTDITAAAVIIGSGGTRVTNHGSHTIRRIDTAGNITTVAGAGDDLGGTLLGGFPGHFDELFEIAIDTNGNIVGVDANGVLRITFP